MGSIRGKWIKKMSINLVKAYPDKFNKNFENNKKALDELNLVDSKSVKNRVAGYIGVLVK